MKSTINYSSIRIDVNKRKMYYYTNEEYSLLRNVPFDSLKDLNISKSPEHYIIFRELLKTNYPEEFL